MSFYIPEDYVEPFIHTSDERKVIAKDNEDNDWIFNDYASKYLKIGKEYTVYDTEIYAWHTRYKLKEFPDQQFHSSHFCDKLGDGSITQ